MDHFYISPDVLGMKDQGLLVSQEGYNFVGKRPKDSWVLGRRAPTEFSLDDVFQLENANIRSLPPEKFSNTILGIPSGSNPRWIEMMPRRDFRAFITKLVYDVRNSVSKCDFNYYLNTWNKITPLFHSLKRMVKVDQGIFQHEFDTSSFKPVSGFCAPIIYNRFGTRTGRLTISSGPQLLTLRKDLRKFLRSRWGDSGQLLSLDFSALEVRLLMSDASGQVSSGDPYVDLSNALHGELNREQAKLALISTVYGSTVQGLIKSLGVSHQQAQRIHEVIVSRYGVDSLVKKLRVKHSADGYIRNRYGRRVEVPEPGDGQLLNSYLQSTGVDVALWGFWEIIQRLDASYAVPVAVLHDALILDVNDEFVKKIGLTLNVPVPGYEGKFPLKISAFNS